MMKKHGNEMLELRSTNRRELDDQELALRTHYTKSFDQYRVQVEREKKEIIEEEKATQLERFRSQAEQIQAGLGNNN